MICPTCSMYVSVLYDEEDACTYCWSCGTIVDSSYIKEEEDYEALDEISEHNIKIKYQQELSDYNENNTQTRK